MLICLSKGYFVHFIFFFVLFICSLIILFYKLKYENSENREKFSNTPSAGPTNSWETISDQIRTHGQCDIGPNYQKYFSDSDCENTFT